MKRIRLPLIPGLEVEFADRDSGLRRVEDWAGRGTRLVKVVYGPEGCGKTAWLKQGAELLREHGYDVIYVDPMRGDFIAYTDLKEVARRLSDVASETLGIAQLKLATLAIDLAKYVLKAGRRRVAVLVDDAFQAIGLGKAALYVKGLLGLIEYPPRGYERVVTIVTTGEGVSRGEIGRHRWSDLMPMWNMAREGFRELYNQIPGDKPSFNEIWKLTGGNPGVLVRLYEEGWRVDVVTMKLIEEKNITRHFISRWGKWLSEAVEDPDILWEPDTPEELINQLVKMNLIMYFLSQRDPWFWVDTPPPERDAELGIGRYVAWQTPLHREAVRRALQILQ